MTNKTITLEVFRYLPGEDAKATFRTYEVPYREDQVILDALNYIKNHIDSTLSFRWSCHMAVCGSCGMMINGEPQLSCHVHLRDYYPRKIRIEPLSNFPVERDLIVDLECFVEKLESIQPYILKKEPKPLEEGNHTQMPYELEKYKQFTACINCLLCYSACPQYAASDEFIGPAALALAHRYNEDSRDEGEHQRLETTASEQGVWHCSFVGACSEVCPKGVDPAAAIQQMKVSSTLDWYKNLVLPKGKS